MADISSDSLRDIAVRCVESFLNDKVPLSVGLAKEASAAELNSDQIQRALEATNTICHLKVLSMTNDRTVEYSLAKYAEVMQHLCLPEVEKQASTNQSQEPQLDTNLESLTKQASTEDAFTLSNHEQRLYFIKSAARNNADLCMLQDRAIVVQSNLVKAAKEISKDEKGMDKLAHVVKENEDYVMLSTLISGSPVERRDFGDHCLFKEAELKNVKTLAELYKEARQLVFEINKRADLQKQASALESELNKQAFLGAMAQGVGYAAGSAVKSIASLPGKALRAVGKGKAGAGAMAVGSAALDASMYTPGINKTTGRSKDVWESLQKP